MSIPAVPLASPRLRALAQPAAPPPAPEASEYCELCGEQIPSAHRHLFDVQARQLRCSCRACSLLFDRRGAAEGSLRLVPDRRLSLPGFRLSEETWDGLRIPVDMAFFTRSSQARRVLALYPSPMGATESQLDLRAWEEVQNANPILATMQDDVEALLVNRARGARGHWLVPIDDAYRLVALIRTRWRGFTGGREVWEELDRFFTELDQRARPERDTHAAHAAGRRHDAEHQPGSV